jgi:hypothetical protein
MEADKEIKFFRSTYMGNNPLSSYYFNHKYLRQTRPKETIFFTANTLALFNRI